MTKRFALFVSLLLVASIAQGSSITINSTGVNTSGGQDQSYQITADSTDGISTPAQAFLVTSTAIGWGSPLSGTAWIGPLANQSNGAHVTGCCVGSTTYETTFTLPSFSSASLNITYLVDDNLTVILNGFTVFTAGGNGPYSGSGAVIPAITVDFVGGTNHLDFVVGNIGGPTGLDVSVSGSFTPAAVPEPATTGLLGSGLLVLGFIAWRRKQITR